MIASNSLYSPNFYHHAHAAAPIVRSAPYIAENLHPFAAPVVAAKTIVPSPILAKTVVAKAVEDYDVHPQYRYAYSVNDALTGDNKAQEEVRDGDIVRGYYTLLEADGTTRKVSYYGKKAIRFKILKINQLFF